jgi:hypothetical protein
MVRPAEVPVVEVSWWFEVAVVVARATARQSDLALRVERVTGIDPAFTAWKLPSQHTVTRENARKKPAREASGRPLSVTGCSPVGSVVARLLRAGERSRILPEQRRRYITRDGIGVPRRNHRPPPVLARHVVAGSMPSSYAAYGEVVQDQEAERPGAVVGGEAGGFELGEDKADRLVADARKGAAHVGDAEPGRAVGQHVGADSVLLVAGSGFSGDPRGAVLSGVDQVGE